MLGKRTSRSQREAGEQRQAKGSLKLALCSCGSRERRRPRLNPDGDENSARDAPHRDPGCGRACEYGLRFRACGPKRTRRATGHNRPSLSAHDATDVLHVCEHAGEPVRPMRRSLHTALAASIVLATATAAPSAPPRSQQISYELTIPIGTHDFDLQKSAPPAGYPTVHLLATCAIGTDLAFDGSTISGNVVAHATGIGTAYGRQMSGVRVTVGVPASSYPRFMALQNHMYLCSFVSGPIRDRTNVVVTPRNISGSVFGKLPVPPAPNS